MATIMSIATPQTPNAVYGKITDANGNPLANIKVNIYDADMRDWQLLSGDFTDKEGKYDLRWTHDQLTGRER